MQNLKFEGFEIRPALRQVWVGGSVSPLGSRAYDLLMLLAEHADRVVPKEEIFSRVWPGVVVEDNNLTVQIAALRRALGSEVVTTVKGRGYQFTARLAQQSAGNPGVQLLGNLPPRELALRGRHGELAELPGLFRSANCVTIIGIAGVGKTALATVAAQRLAGSRAYAQGAWRIELATIRDPQRLPHTVCQTLGVEIEGKTDPVAECVNQLRHGQLLLILDNCEHMIEAVAALAAQISQHCPRVHLMCTSQEPLRIEGERVLRLAPLPVPASAEQPDAHQYGAVELLHERIRDAMGGQFEPTREEFAELVEICRQLDGIPLALEFAATRVPLLGVAGVRSRLHDRLRLLRSGSRTSPERHRSLQAALEWSHQLLNPRTQWILHRLAVFPGGFSLVGAQLLIDAESDAELLEHLDLLVERSLISNLTGSPAHYRMLETTRAFALDCLRASGDTTDWNARLAACMANLCVLAARERDSAWIWREMPNARAALAWAIATPGQAATAVTIATYTSVVLAAGGAIGEALDNLESVRALVSDDLPIALGARYWQWVGRLGVEGRLPTSVCIEALHRAQAVFTQLGEPRHRHACHRYLAEAYLRAGQHEQARAELDLARPFEAAESAMADRLRRLRVETLLANATGQHAEALRLAQSALTMAEAHHIDRYRLLLMADMGWIHLQAGRADAAASSFHELLLHLEPSIRQGLARARAMTGLMVALLTGGRTADALRVARNSLLTLQQTNLLRARCDVFAWAAGAAGNARVAAQLLGLSEAFLQHSEVERDAVSKLASQHAHELVRQALPDENPDYWVQAAAGTTDAELLHLLQETFRQTMPHPPTRKDLP